MTNTPKPQANRLDEVANILSSCLTGDVGSIILYETEAVEKLNAHYLKEFLDMIGEDEKLRPNHSKMSQITHQIETRNFLKMQYRKAAKERLK